MKNLRPGTALSVLLGLSCLLAAALPTAATDSPSDANDKRLEIMYESFETSMPPDGWHRYGFGDADDWSRTFARRRTGAFSAWIESGPAGTTQDEWLVAPVDLTGTVAPEVEWYESENDWAALGGHHMLMVSMTSPTDTTTFSILLDMTPVNHVIGGFEGDPVVIDLTAYAGEPVVYLAWRYIGSAADDWYIDDIRVFEALDVDVRGIAMTPAETHHQAGDAITPVATFYNDGQSAVSFDAELEVLASGSVVHDETVAVTDVPAGEHVDVTFTNYTLADGHLYELQATAVAPGDGNPHNDATASYIYTYTEPHVPLGLLFTNTGCIPCVDTNQALDAYLPGMGDAVACIRVHTPWPDYSDIIYHFNPAQADALIEEYNITQAPTFFMDGHLGDYFPAAIAPQYEAQLELGSPTAIEMIWSDTPDELIVTVNNREMIRPDVSLRLLVAITEDDIYYVGPNGEEHHNQALHGFMPDTDGTFPVSIEPGRHDFQFTVDLSGTLVYENLRATAYLQSIDTDEVMQAGTAFLAALDTTVSAVNDVPAPRAELDSCVPNPFNPSTSVVFRLPAAQAVELAVYALDGTRVATLHSGVLTAGEHRVTWHGTDDGGQPLASGAYFARLVTPSASLTRSMMLLK